VTIFPYKTSQNFSLGGAGTARKIVGGREDRYEAFTGYLGGMPNEEVC